MADNPIFSYTKRDYESSRKEGLAKIPILSKGAWTDLNATDPGIIILDYVHALVDMANYYQDHQALESFISTAKERANIFRLAKQFSYKIRSSKGATCDVTFTSNLSYDHPVLIPKHTAVSTSNDITYLTTEDYYLPSNTASITIPCTQGILQERTYTGTGISRYSNVVAAANQLMTLPSNTIDIDSIILTDNTGEIWTSVEYITFSDAGEKVYQVELNPDNTISIKFGDGERGYVPQETDILRIQYIVTAAEEGKVGANTIRYLKSPLSDRGMYIEFAVSNNRASIGGFSAQSSESIKEVVPKSMKSQDRAVTRSDFENLALSIEGVSAVKGYDINNDPDRCLHFEVKVLIVPEDLEGDTEVLRQKVYQYLHDRMIPPIELQVLTPEYVYVDIEVTVKALYEGRVGGIEHQIRQKIENYFSSRSRLIGESFYPIDLSAVLSSTENIRSIVSLSPSTPVNISEFSIIRLGDVHINII